MSAIALGAAAIGAGASVYNGIQARNAASAAGNKSQVDINALNNQIQALSTSNALASANLEKQLNPQAAALRTGSETSLLNQLQPSQANQQSSYLLQQGLGQNLNTPLLNQAIAQAQQQLSLGGQLPQDVQNQVTRQALANGGTVAGPGGGLNLGRDLSARDLGLSSLQLQQQRLQTGLQAGGAQQNLAQANQANLLQHISALQGLGQQQFNNTLNAAQFGNSIQQPQVGLSPASAGNIAVGNQNAQGAALSNQANIYGQQSQNYLNLAGQLGGYGLLNYNNSSSSGVGAPTTYGNFVSQNPYSSAATGGNNVGTYTPVQNGGFFPPTG